MADKRLHEGKARATLAALYKFVVTPFANGLTEDPTGDDEYIAPEDISTYFKATGAEVDTGTDDSKFATSKAIADSSYIKNVMTTAGDIIYAIASGVQQRLAKGTAGQVLTMNAGATAPEWSDSSGGGAPDMLTLFERAGIITTGVVGQIQVERAMEIDEGFSSINLIPTGDDIQVDIRLNGTASTDSIFQSDTPLEHETTDSLSNGRSLQSSTLIDNGTCSAGDVLNIVVVKVGTTIAGAGLQVRAEVTYA